MFDLPFMIQSPLAMLGLVTLLVPLGIHLLSKARPRVIAFAHIAFITVKTSPVLRQLRLTQLILLGVRMMMLLLATLILAQLYWVNIWPSTQQNDHTHILLTEDWLNNATDAEKQTLTDQVSDSDLVLLSTKNRRINKAELAQWSPVNSNTPVLNVWNKVSDYTASLSSNEAITVYTTNRLKQFIGSKTPVFERVKWQVKTIAVENITQQYPMNIIVMYDDSHEPLLVYLRGAFATINTHDKLLLKVIYVMNNSLEDNSEHLLNYDSIIDLSEQSLAQQQRHLHAPRYKRYKKRITQSELHNIKQADFVLTLAQLLYSTQSQVWWLDNTRLTTEQITQSMLLSDDHKTLSPNKASTSKNTQPTSLHIWLVLMLVAIFILERWLSEWPNRQLKPRLDK